MADAQGAFVTRSFEKLLRDSNARRFPKLHQALKAYLDRPKDAVLGAASPTAEAPSPTGTSGDNAAASAAASSMAEAGHGFDTPESQVILVPLRLAMESKQSKLMETALDCLHKLIEYGHLQGDCGLEGGRNNAGNTELFQLVCNSADNTAVDTVVLQVIKVLLTAVASPLFQVHGDALILALRTLYNIVLNSKSHNNISTARGTLSQMISVVFKRMEVQQQKQASISVAKRQIQAADATDSPMISPVPLSHEPTEANGQVDVVSSNGEGEGNGRVMAEGSGAAAVLEAAGVEKGAPNLQALEAALDRAVLAPSTEEGATPADDQKAQAQPGSKAGNSVGGARSDSERGVALDSLATMGQRDALLLFRTLCKMAMKDGTEEIVTRTKILSLQLLQGLLETVSDEFTVNFEFLDTVKMHLCYALVRACVSPDDRVFQCSCDIFSVLVRRYRESLKAEIGLFFPLMVLRPLDNADMTLAQRSTTLGMLDDLTADPQVLADIFVNYDCDLEAKNLFERMVKSLARTAGSSQTGSHVGQATQQQRPGGADLSSHLHAHGPTGPATPTHVKTAAVQALVNVMRSLDTWFAKDKPELRKGKAGVSPRSIPDPDEVAALVAEGQDKLADSQEISFQGSKSEDSFSKANVEAFTSVDLSDGDFPPGGLNAAVSQADQFEKKKAQKLLIEEAVFQFNMKPEKGVKFLIRHGVLQSEPNQVAQFLRTTPGLDKTAIGDYLGQHDDFQLSVMHRYCESVAFKGLKFDQAIRVFLQGFRLPGEAQKIDRIMEKFAERYCCDNPGVFKNADAAYVLAYAVIMLNTDAHNPVIEKKMTKADFVRMNAATSTDGGGAVEEAVPVALLEEIYDSIVTNEIKLRDDDGKGKAGKAGAGPIGLTDERLLSILNLQTARRKTAAELKAESDDIVKRTQALVKRSSAAATAALGGRKDIPLAAASTQQRVFSSALDAELARPMLETVGWPLVATVSMAMEDPEARHPRVVLCLEGLRLGIHLSLLMGLDTLRYAFLTSLVRYTYLHAPREMRMKNVEATKTLLLLAEQDPDALQDTWNAVLECVSRLEHIVTTPALSSSLMSMNNQVSRDALLAALQELTARPLEQVFVVSSRLPSDAVVEFFTALCAVSAEELRQAPPRVFSLQKLVEISYYNMTRIRMIWARIWALLSVHFIAAGQHPDQQVAMYAMDSIRQLALKYLERAELANFTFQNDILKPFVVVMRTSKSELIREFILQCVIQMIKLKVTGIKSGWRSVFMVLTTAAADPYEPVVDLAFENAENVVLENFDQIVGDCFMDCVNCLMAFSNNPTSPRISLKAIALLRICEDRLAEGRVPGGVVRPVNEGERVSDSDVAEYYWFPMLAGLSDLTSDPRPEVRACAVEVLFDLLKERGHKFSTRFWESTFERILFPIFDYVRHAGSGGEKPGPADLWLRDTSIHCLHLLCDLFCHFYHEVRFVLPSLLGLLLDCATRPDQTLAAVSVGALIRLMDGGAKHFTNKDWAMLLDSIKEAIVATRPSELIPEDAEKATEGGALEESTSSSNQQHAGKERSPQLPAMILTGDAAAALLGPTLTDTIPAAAEEGENGGEDVGRRESAASGNEEGKTAEGSRESSGGVQANSVAAEPQEGLANGPESMAAEEDATTPSSAKNRASESTDASGLGRRIMDALLLRNVSMSIGRQRSSSTTSVGDSLVLQPEPTPSAEVLEQKEVLEGKSRESTGDVPEPEGEESMDVIPHSVRVKCYTQLLLLGALDRLQAEHWRCLNGPLRTKLADCVTLGLDFAVVYNNDQNFRVRMRQHGAERPPFCLLRQEALGTQLLLTVLLRALRDPAVHKLSAITVERMHLPCSFSIVKEGEDRLPSTANGGDSITKTVSEGSFSPLMEPMQPGAAAAAEEEEAEAEKRLLTLCERVLQVSAGLQPGGGQAVEAEVHRSLALRAPIVSTVLLALSAMDSDRFERFAEYLYSHCTRLICSDQMDVRKALADLFRERLLPMVPVS